MISKQNLKNKVINHIMIKGNKLKGEKILSKTLKSLQKTEIKPHNSIMKSAVLNSMPIFRLIKLKKKSKKKKGNKSQTKEIPAFLSNYFFRTSWSIKYMVLKSKQNANIFHSNFKNEVLLNSQNLGESVSVKNEIQKQALKKKLLFRYYRW